jgi:hypothetical protein
MRSVKMKKIEAGSYYSYLTEGCRICRRGAKLVLFVTGKCMHSCYYCPISEERKGRDVVYANERRVSSFGDILKEIELMDAEGASITGGEPLMKLGRVVEYLRLLNSLDLHVHLYTSIAAKENVLRKLYEKGLDEIRFHPPELENIGMFEKSLAASKRLGMEAGFEIPSLRLRFSQEIVKILNKYDVFLNLNELEFSSTNYSNLVERGYEVGEFYGAKGSDEIARMFEVVNKFHYCTALFKDKVQLRRRFIRMALNHPKFYELTKEGTIVCGFIEGNALALEKVKNLLKELKEQYLDVERAIETSVGFVEERCEHLKAMGLKVSIIERHPTSKRVVVEVIPL